MIHLGVVGHTTHLVCRSVGSCRPSQKISGKSLFREVFGRPYTLLHGYIWSLLTRPLDSIASLVCNCRTRFRSPRKIHEALGV